MKNIFTDDELKQRAFFRAAWVLYHYWEEQRDDPKKEARVHSRLFDTLVPDVRIILGTSIKGKGWREHLVPCALIRDEAFRMYHSGMSMHDVAKMIGRNLRIAHITKEERDVVDSKYKTTMPDGWDFETGKVTARLDEFGVEIA